MILVFLLLAILIILSLISLMLLMSSIKIEITKLHINKNNFAKLKIKFVSKFGIYLFNKIKLFNITIDDDKIKDFYNSGKIDINKLKDNKEINKEAIKLLKNVNFEVESLILKGYISTENAAFTAVIASLINIIIPLLLMNRVKKYKKNKFNYRLNAVYYNQNIANLNFTCIFSIKIVHIINIIYILLRKESVNKNERTSNRRTYAYSHE